MILTQEDAKEGAAENSSNVKSSGESSGLHRKAFSILRNKT
jgi:hypothetical protein